MVFDPRNTQSSIEIATSDEVTGVIYCMFYLFYILTFHSQRHSALSNLIPDLCSFVLAITVHAHSAE